MGRDVYILQATLDTRPEDLLVTPVIEGGGKLRYVASPLVTAMIRGGIAILDEGNRMSEKSWASLAPLLDNRRYVESIVAGIKIKAHPHFRLVATMNDDASHLRTARVHPLAPAAADLHRFSGARRRVPHPQGEPAVRRRAHPELRDRFPAAWRTPPTSATRCATASTSARFAIKLKSLATQRTHETEALEIAVIQVLGEEALRYARRNRPSDS